MSKHFKSFILNESGVETMEWISILLVAAALIAIAATIASKMQSGLKEAAEYI